MANSANYNLNLPNKGTQNWDQLMNQNFDKIDTELHGHATSMADMVNLKSNFEYEIGDIRSMDIFLSALRSKSCKVVFWGDSITAGADSIDWYSVYTNAFTRKLKQQFPSVTFTTYNYGIGGRTIENASDSTYTSPDKFTASWATTAGKAWRDYVKDVNPDLVVLAFGMNNPTFVESVGYYLETIKNYINTWTKIPSLLMVTNYLPREEWATTNGRIDRLCHMRATRSYANYNNFTVLDIGNRFRKLVDGINENSFIAQRYINFDQFSGDTVKTSSFSVENFQLQFNTNFSTTTNITIKFGKGNKLELTKTTAKWYKDTTVIASATWAVPDGSNLVIITRTNESIGINAGSQYASLVAFSDFREGALIIEKVGETMDFTNFYCTAYFNTPSKQLLSVEDVLGTYVVGDTSTKYPFGGNGVNHHTSKMTEFVYMPEWNKFLDNVKIALARQVSVPYVAPPTKLLSSSFSNCPASGWGTNGGLNSGGLQIKYKSVGTTLITLDKNYLRKITDSSYLTYHSLNQTNIQLLQINEYAIVNSGGTYLLFVVTPDSDYDFYETKYNLVTQ